MARRNKTSKSKGRTPSAPYGAMPPDIANPWPSPPRPVLPLGSLLPSPTRSYRILQDVEDRRTFHPNPLRRARSLSRPNHLLKAFLLNANARSAQGRSAAKRSDRTPGSTKAVSTGGRFPSPSIRIGFHDPALICVRRAQRKEVLFAKSKGRTIKSKRAPKKNYYSSILCRSK